MVFESMKTSKGRDCEAMPFVLLAYRILENLSWKKTSTGDMIVSGIVGGGRNALLSRQFPILLIVQQIQRARLVQVQIGPLIALPQHIKG